jgi:hypothetical protein
MVRKDLFKKGVRRIILHKKIADGFENEMLKKALDAIDPLSKSIKEHKKFKQMAAFSIDSIDKLLDKQNTMYQWYIQACIQRQLHVPVVDVLMLHVGDVRLLKAATHVLQLLADAAETTVEEHILREGGFGAILQTIQQNPDLEATEVGEVLELLLQVAQDAPVNFKQNPYSKNMTYAAADIKLICCTLGLYNESAEVQVKCFRLLALIGRSEQTAVLTCEQSITTVVGTMLAAQASCDDEEDISASPGTVQLEGMAVLRVLSSNQSCRAMLGNAAVLKTVGGAVVSNPDNEELLREAGMVVAQLLSRDIDEAIATLTEVGIDVSTRWFLLSLDPHHLPQVAERGGLQSLLHDMSQEGVTPKVSV